MLNPYGDDDEDFEINYLIDRNLQVGNLGINQISGGTCLLILLCIYSRCSSMFSGFLFNCKISRGICIYCQISRDTLLVDIVVFLEILVYVVRYLEALIYMLLEVCILSHIESYSSILFESRGTRLHCHQSSDNCLYLKNLFLFCSVASFREVLLIFSSLIILFTLVLFFHLFSSLCPFLNHFYLFLIN